MKKLFGALLLVAMAGCSSSPVSLSEATPAPRDRVYGMQIPDSAQRASITFVRDSGYVGGGCDMGIYVNSKLVARLQTGEKAAIAVPAGQLIVGAGGVGDGLCGASASRRERDVTISAGESKNYRIFISGSGDVDILPTTM
ncbi:hypothetical protein [Pseudomonas panipatensis]|uniref:hypothetical protein n=1 Tax=Pseudomonas panipatensis TaxID=428992 RepID=UPI001BB01A56|nr:hypothetical protein [Pseudomonas panipatensis]